MDYTAFQLENEHLRYKLNRLKHFLKFLIEEKRVNNYMSTYFELLIKEFLEINSPLSIDYLNEI